MLIFNDYYTPRILTSKGHKYEKNALFDGWRVKYGFLYER